LTSTSETFYRDRFLQERRPATADCQATFNRSEVEKVVMKEALKRSMTKLTDSREINEKYSIFLYL